MTAASVRIESLEVWHVRMRLRIEFRHASWFVDEVYGLLEKHRAALCINDGDDSTTPIKLTAPASYVRQMAREWALT